MFCRLCSGTRDLCDMFGSRLSDEQLCVQKCSILLGTGVEIRKDDIVSKMVCHTCCELVEKMYKYRVNAVANDKRLKERAGQTYKPPITDLEELKKITTRIFAEGTNSASDKNDITSINVEEKTDTNTCGDTESITQKPITNDSAKPIQENSDVVICEEVNTNEVDMVVTSITQPIICDSVKSIEPCSDVLTCEVEICEATPDITAIIQKPILHDSVNKLIQQYPDVKLPCEVNNCDVSPVITLDESEVTDWHEEYFRKCKQKLSLGNIVLKRVDANKNEKGGGDIEYTNTADEAITNIDDEIGVSNTEKGEVIPSSKPCPKSQKPYFPLETPKDALSSEKEVEDVATSESTPLPDISTTQINDVSTTTQEYITPTKKKRKPRRNVLLSEFVLDDEVIPQKKNRLDFTDINCVSEPPVTKTTETGDIEVFFCETCMKLFDTNKQLRLHQRCHLSCSYCKLRMPSVKRLQLHEHQSCHKKIMDNLPQLQLTRVDEIKSIVDKYSSAFKEPEEDTPTLASEVTLPSGTVSNSLNVKQKPNTQNKIKCRTKQVTRRVSQKKSQLPMYDFLFTDEELTQMLDVTMTVDDLPNTSFQQPPTEAIEKPKETLAAPQLNGGLVTVSNNTVNNTPEFSVDNNVVVQYPLVQYGNSSEGGMPQVQAQPVDNWILNGIAYPNSTTSQWALQTIPEDPPQSDINYYNLQQPLQYQTTYPTYNNLIDSGNFYGRSQQHNNAYVIPSNNFQAKSVITTPAKPSPANLQAPTKSTTENGYLAKLLQMVPNSGSVNDRKSCPRTSNLHQQAKPFSNRLHSLLSNPNGNQTNGNVSSNIQYYYNQNPNNFGASTTNVKNFMPAACSTLNQQTNGSYASGSPTSQYVPTVTPPNKAGGFQSIIRYSDQPAAGFTSTTNQYHLVNQTNVNVQHFTSTPSPNQSYSVLPQYPYASPNLTPNLQNNNITYTMPDEVPLTKVASPTIKPKGVYAPYSDFSMASIHDSSNATCTNQTYSMPSLDEVPSLNSSVIKTKGVYNPPYTSLNMANINSVMQQTHSPSYQSNTALSNSGVSPSIGSPLQQTTSPKGVLRVKQFWELA